MKILDKKNLIEAVNEYYSAYTCDRFLKIQLWMIAVDLLCRDNPGKSWTRERIKEFLGLEFVPNRMELQALAKVSGSFKLIPIGDRFLLMSTYKEEVKE